MTSRGRFLTAAYLRAETQQRAPYEIYGTYTKSGKTLTNSGMTYGTILQSHTALMTRTRIRQAMLEHPRDLCLILELTFSPPRQ